MASVISRLVPYQNAECGRCNVSAAERWLTGAAGVALAGLGIARMVRSRGTAADAEGKQEQSKIEGARTTAALEFAGAAALLARAVSGFCPVYALIGKGSSDAAWAPETDTAARRTLSGNRGFRVRETVTIARPVAEVYAFWRQLENLPRFMQHLESVRMIDERRSHWVARGPAGTNVEWDAEIVTEEPNRLISWRTLPEADAASAGSVTFEEAPGTGTIITVTLQYQPPAGTVGVAVARMFGEEPPQQIYDDLQRLKAMLEAQEPVGSRQ